VHGEVHLHSAGEPARICPGTAPLSTPSDGLLSDRNRGLRRRPVDGGAGLERGRYLCSRRVTEFMLRQCCVPAPNGTKSRSTSHNYTQLDSKLSASLARNQLTHFGFLDPFLFSNPSSPAAFTL